MTVLFIAHKKCFYLVIDKEEHLYYYKNRKQTNVREQMFCLRRKTRKEK